MILKDVTYLIGLLAMLVVTMVLLFFALTYVSGRMEENDRCTAAGGVMTRDWQCVQKLEGF